MWQWNCTHEYEVLDWQYYNECLPCPKLSISAQYKLLKPYKRIKLCPFLINPPLHKILTWLHSPCCLSCQRPCRWGRQCGPPPRSHPGAGQCQSWGRWTTAGTPSWPRPPLRSPLSPPPPHGGHTSPGSHRKLWSILGNEQYL